jgi:hypothetical protein
MEKKNYGSSFLVLRNLYIKICFYRLAIVASTEPLENHAEIKNAKQKKLVKKMI